MIEHLQECRGGLDHKDISEIASERDAEWDITKTPAVYFNKVEKAIKEIQDDLSKSLEEFKKSHGFDFNAEAITLPAEAKLSVQITEDEKKAIEAKSAPAPEKK